MKLTMPLTITAADSNSRTISGRVVTWNEIGSTSAGLTSFLPESIPTKNVKLLLEHDRTRPIGKVLSMTATDQGIDAVFSIALTNAGSDALIEAATGLRDGFSVGVKVDAWDNKDGVLTISKGNLDEVSLVSDPAIDSARVSDVAASENSDPVSEETETKNNPTEGEQVDTTTVQDQAPAEETVEAAKITATNAGRPVLFTSPRSPIVSAASFLEHSVKAARGNEDSRQYVVHANSTADNPGLIPTRQLTEVVNGLADSVRASIDSISTMALPNAGMTFQIPKITVMPTVSQVDELETVTPTNMETEFIDVDVKSFKGNQIMSVELADRSDPVFYQLLLQNLTASYAQATNEYNSGKILLGSTSGSPTYAAPISPVNILKWISDGSVSIYSNTHKFADAVVMSPAQWGNVMSMSVDGRPIYNALQPQNAAGNAQPRSLRGSINGIDLWVDTALSGTGDGSMYVINRDAYTWFESPALTLTANNTSNGSISVLLYGYGATATKIAAGAYNFQAS
jgi:HK97 family phage prohead protease